MVAPGRWVPLTLAAALLLVPAPTTAHGAPADRDIDVRVLQDWTGPAGEHVGEYSGMHTPPVGDGHDLLALDVREAYNLSSGTPDLLLRLIMQVGDTTDGWLKEEIHFSVGGKEQAFHVQTKDGETYTHNFESLTGPTPVGDGFPFAIEGRVGLDTIGAKVGDELTDFEVHGHFLHGGQHDMEEDHMPGGFSASGAPVEPAPGSDDSVTREYTVKGPPELISLGLPTEPVAVPAAGQGLVLNLTAQGNGTQIEQFVNLTIAAPPGFVTNVTKVALRVGAQAKTVPITVTAPGAARRLEGTLQFTAVSDLGSIVTRSVFVHCAPLPDTAGGNGSNGAGSPGASSTTAPGTSTGVPAGKVGERGVPGPGAWAFLLAAGVAVAWRTRRA